VPAAFPASPGSLAPGMPTVYVQRRVHFNAAHRLHNPEKSDEWNRETYGPCNHPNWHGHNYVLEVVVAGEPDPETGYLIDLGVLKRIVSERVVDKVDHKNLNLDVDFMDGIIPSTENFAVAIWNQLDGHLPSGRLHLVRLYETPRNSVEYRGE
jgi:6-pyruvoyltetrahydropterin/6-carboxytetrahydropterin synthase